MSDAPKPKPGSLRDRIAAFEKQPAALSGSAPPAPRPKPSGLQWKPRQASPPPAVDDSEGVKKGGMSASDAKETIGKGVSLKERMAALNNRGAFGGAPTSPPPTAPKPNVERSKWKPPPVVAPPADEDTDDAPPVTSPPVSADKPAADEQEQPTETEESQEAPADNDEEEEERQRRAALAARMARLGGARVGMAPPVLGRKPKLETKPAEEPKEEEAKASFSEDAQAEPSSERQAAVPQESSEAPAVHVQTEARRPDKAASQDESIEEKKPSDSEPAKSTSQDDSSENKISDATSPPAAEDSPLTSPPSAASPRMPVPAAPRRAAPPRKKAVKSPAPPEPEPVALAAPVNVAEAVETSQDTVEAPTDAPRREAEIGNVDKSADPIDVGPEEKEDKPTDVLVDQDKVVEEPAPLASEEPVEDKDAPTEAKVTPDTTADEPVRKSTADRTEQAEHRSERATSPKAEKGDSEPPQISSSAPEYRQSAEVEESVPEADGPAPAQSAAAEAKSPPADEEEDEEARRKRVAERIAKMGGINPFATQPRRQSNVASQEATSPTDQPRRQSSTQIRETSFSVADDHRSPPAPKQSFESSTGSIGSAASEQPERSLPSTSDPAKDQKLSGRSLETEKLEQDDVAEGKAPVEEGVVRRQDTRVSEPGFESKGTRGPSRTATEENAPSSSPESPTRALPDRPSQTINRTLSSSMHEDEPRASFGRPASTGSSHRQEKEPESSESEYDEREQDSNPLVLPPRTVTSVISSPSPAPSPPPTRVPPPNKFQTFKRDDEAGAESDSEPRILSPPARPARSMPPPPPRPDTDDEMPESDEEETNEKALPLPSRRSEDRQKSEVDEGDSALPTPPRRGIPSPPSNAARAADNSEDEEEDEDEEHHTPTIAEQEQAKPGLSEQRRQSTSETEHRDNYPSHEILDEDEGDPIDPSFHSPHAPQSNVQPQAPDMQTPADRPISPPVKPLSPEPKATSSQEPESTARDEDEEGADAEQARRRTIAERMAKLGGIKFGAAPPMGRPMPVARRETEAQSPPEAQDTSEEPASHLTEEEEEAARKQRIAAKMATMGGMRFGMVPPGVQARSPPPRRESQDATSARSAAVEDTTPPPLPPSRPPPPPANRPPPTRAPPPPASETGSEYESTATSDDGIKVEAEESEIEEVSHRDAVEEPEMLSEEEAPPVPARPAQGSSGDAARKSSSASTSSGGRPPIPSTTQVPPRKSSTGSAYSPRASTQRPPIPQQQSDFVMVDESEEAEAPPPPPPQKRTSMPPSRNVPPPPSGSGSSQWEMPSVNFDDSSADLSLSWSEDSTMYPTEHKRVSQLPPGAAAPGPVQTGAQHELPSNLQLSADELMSVWGKVGVHLYTASSTLYENSKKMLVGDGTYNGFIRAAMREVPNALVVDSPADTFGYLVYHQNGASVQKRASEIMPGDVVFVADAKFKGHKGLQAYSQHFGTGVGGSVLGVVSEFEPKKSKVKVYQANQHVGQQTVESVSYRLDDLKTGVFKVFRVLEA